jgi:ligand-binding SRPBCC domain-containing protein
MRTVTVNTRIAAPPQRCFDLARSVEAHVASAGDTGERAVAGRTSGLLELGDEVTWEARHFGVRQRLTSRITAFDAPHYFQDTMVRGALKSLVHDHHFEPTPDGQATVMRDVLVFAAPGGPIGWLAERLVLAGHLRRFLQRRGEALRKMAQRPTHA